MRRIYNILLALILSILLASCSRAASGRSEGEGNTDGTYQSDINISELSETSDTSDTQDDTSDTQEETLEYSPSGEEDTVDFDDLLN